MRRAAAELRGEGAFLAHNADSLSDVDPGDLASWHARSGFAATLVLAPTREGYTPVDVDDAGRVVSIGGGRGRYLFTGMHILDESLLTRVPEGPSDIVRDFYLDLVREGTLGGYLHPGFWWEFGSPRSYLEGSLALLALAPERLESIVRTDAVRRAGDATVAVGLGADFHSGVALAGRVALGMACLIGEGSVLEDTVIMPEAWVGPGSRLRRVVVGPGAELPAGFELEDALVCTGGDSDLEPPPGTVRQGSLFVTPLVAGR
jgi:glucose-1-phosphate adenylyltransferase